MVTKRKKKAFTLVELILVIVIISILSTIGYISFIGYYGSTRDVVRVTDITTIFKGLNIYKIGSGNYPLPDNYVDIKAGDNLLTYQGEAGTNITNIIKSVKSITDPKDNRNYILAVDRNKNKAQLMGFLEKGENTKYITFHLLEQVFAYENLNYSDRLVYTYGDKIGVITDKNKVPLQYTTSGTGINLLNISETGTGINTYFGGSVYENGKSSSTGNILVLQIDNSLNGVLPCSPEIYNDYNISSINNNDTKNFTKTVSITNGSQNFQLSIKCINGDLDKSNAIETVISTTCSMPGYSFNGNYSSPACIDNIAPTITNITSSTPSCNTVRFTINGATDNAALDTSPYSFDGGSTWQTLNYKDFSSTNYTVNANLIKVRDTSGNTYIYASSINGTSAVCTCNLPWGGTINNGQSITAYGASSVACGSSCSSQTRTCTNGVLSGTYSYGSCSVAACASCNLPWGGTISSGQSVTAYGASSVACGSSCSSQTRTCTNGALSGTYSYGSCSVQSCSPPVNGVCGSVIDLGGMIGESCSVGTKINASGVGCGVTHTWQCQGSNGGTTANCSGSVTCGCGAGGPSCWAANCCGSWSYTSAGSQTTVYDGTSPGTGTYTARCDGNGVWTLISSSCN